MNNLTYMLCFIIMLCFEAKAFTIPTGEFAYQNFPGKLHYRLTSLYPNELPQFLQDSRAWTEHFGPLPNVGLTSDYYWVSFSLHNPFPHARDVIIEADYAFYDELRLIHQTDEGIETQFLSDLVPFSEREIQSLGMAFPVVAPANSSSKIYLVAKSAENILFPLGAYSPKAYYSKVQNDQLALGLIFGAIFILFIYNLLVYISTRDKSYLAYVVYIFCHGLFQVAYTGIGFQYLWKDYPVIQKWCLHLSAPLALASFLYFLRKFLDLRTFLDSLDRSLLWLSYGILSLAFVLPWFEPQWGIGLLTGVSILVAIITFIPLVKMSSLHYRPAKFFLIAFIILLFFTIMNGVAIFGGLQFNQFILRSPQIGFLLEGILLSFGLADRINLLKKEKELAQLEAAENRVHKKLAELARQVAHDIKSPLAAIKTLTQEFISNKHAQAPILKLAAERIEGILQDLNQKEKTEKSAQTFLIADHLRNLLTEKKLEVKQQYQGEKQLTLQIKDDLKLKGDLDDLLRALSNILNNALEAVGPNGLVEISCEKLSEHKGLICIRDNGQGMTTEQLQLAGQKGQTFSKAHGSGLGLYQAQQAVSACGGSLQLISPGPGQGSEVRLFLPL